MYIRRRDNESIDDFITHYNMEALQIGGVSEDFMKVGFIQGARSKELIRYLTGRDGMPKTWSEIMTATKIFAWTEKALSNQSVTEKKEHRDTSHVSVKSSEKRTKVIDFLVLPVNSEHNVILGREALVMFNAIPSTAHRAIGFPTPTGVAIIWAGIECATTEGFRPAKSLRPSETSVPEKWILNPIFPEQPITIGATISHGMREHLKQLLTKYADVFAWQICREYLDQWWSTVCKLTKP
ncbi:hypothetical protein L1987_53218 [Smallanthus sonchifolius]|uniref:Uncharacterized protein n=1 Tax=Smallanthus sonchifolius TaxID=185202 RepID=A0ACB9EWH5_9ASTR|nr:hypothetical protein L1987_53218 [Smallanthus sonchifolius]